MVLKPAPDDKAPEARTRPLEECAVEPGFGRMAAAELRAMVEAGEEAVEIERLLAKTGDNVVGELIKGEETFYEWNHYPDGDVYDPETGSQFFYHAHPAELRVGEHGHFHTFLRPAGMPDGIQPAPLSDLDMPAEPNDALSHLIGISMDAWGKAICLFTTNRWVTGEVWYEAPDVIAMLERFGIGHTQPSWPVNRWLTAMLRLFRPQIAALIEARDEAIAAWQEAHAGGDEALPNVFEDRSLEITSFRHISVDDQLRRARDALEQA